MFADLIGLLTPTQLGSFSPTDSLKIAQALSSQSRQIDKATAQSIGANIPMSTSPIQVLAAASGIPMECFGNANATDLVKNLAKMDTANMDDFKKSFITSKVFEFLFFKN